MKMQCNKPSDSNATHKLHQCSECSVEQRSITSQSVVSSVASNNHTSLSSIAPSTMSSSAPGKDACDWPTHTIDALIDILFEYHSTGKITGKTVREPVWLEVQVELFNRTKVNYSISQIKAKHKRLKNEWKIFHHFVISTRGVWNPLQFNIDVKPELFEKFKENEDFKRVQKKGLKRYDVMTHLWAEGTASGVFARSCNNAGPSLEEETEMQHTHYSFAPAEGSGGKTSTGKRRFDIHSPYPTSQSTSSSKRKVEELQCAVLKTFLDEASVNGGTVKWTAEQCLADVRKVEGITPADVVNAGEKFEKEINRAIYMNHTAEEKVEWVNKYCKPKINN